MTEKYRISTGRGGAGNIHASDSRASPKLIKQGSQTPSILQPVYSTGRGGAGNMRRNTDPKLTRRAQDVDSMSEDLIDIDELMYHEDYIEPVNPVGALQADDNETAVDTSIGGRKQSRSHTSRSRSRSRSKSRLSKTLSATKSNTKHKPQEKVIIGRGGAGNIISPKSSNPKAKHMNSKNQNNKDKDKTKKKKGFLSSITSMFSST